MISARNLLSVTGSVSFSTPAKYMEYTESVAGKDEINVIILHKF